MASSSAADDNDMEKARSLGRCAMWVNVTGILVTVVLIIVFVALWFTVFNVVTVCDPFDILCLNSE